MKKRRLGGGSVTSARSYREEEKVAASYKWCAQGFSTPQEAELGRDLEPRSSRPGWTTRVTVSTKRERNRGDRDIWWVGG